MLPCPTVGYSSHRIFSRGISGDFPLNLHLLLGAEAGIGVIQQLGCKCICKFKGCCLKYHQMKSLDIVCMTAEKNNKKLHIVIEPLEPFGCNAKNVVLLLGMIQYRILLFSRIDGCTLQCIPSDAFILFCTYTFHLHPVRNLLSFVVFRTINFVGSDFHLHLMTPPVHLS